MFAGLNVKLLLFTAATVVLLLLLTVTTVKTVNVKKL